MRLNKTLGLGLIAFLILNIAAVVTASPWDGVPDDHTPAQSIWVDPKEITCLNIGETFVVDVLINLTDPAGAATGLFGFEYKLQWDAAVLEIFEIQTHTDNVPGGDLLPGWTMIFVASNDTSTPGVHGYSVAAVMGSAFTGVDSLCTYTFQVVGNGNSILDVYDDILVDDTAAEIGHTTTDGTYCPPSVPYQLTIAVEGSGTTTPSPGNYIYNEGTMVSVDAIPDPGWKLDHWLLDNANVGAADPYEVAMDNDHNLTAVFTEKPPTELIGDVNKDGIVNIFDAIPIGVAFGSRPGSPRWNPIADIVPDDFINIQDIVLWATHFGETA